MPVWIVLNHSECVLWMNCSIDACASSYAAKTSSASGALGSIGATSAIVLCVVSSRRSKFIA
eukprot:363771-Chlamydomonas_euryale.AAC.15